jgi:hypothetical protein
MAYVPTLLWKPNVSKAENGKNIQIAQYAYRFPLRKKVD